MMFLTIYSSLIDEIALSGYHAIRGRKEFLLYKKNILPENLVTTIICAGTPRAVFEYAEQRLKCPFVTTNKAGYYKINETPPTYLIVINELPIIPVNYPLLLFASKGQKFREFLEEAIATGEHTYIRYAYKIRGPMTREVLTMAGFPSSMTRENLEFIIDDIGDDIFAIMELDDILEKMGVAKQEQLASFIPTKTLLKAWMLKNSGSLPPLCLQRQF